uniref:Uncharacterized protein n=1 Tax=Anguilla anguilla TaxID=7936 RepID=A0A0E9VLU7_ANGAN
MSFGPWIGMPGKSVILRFHNPSCSFSNPRETGQWPSW